MHNVPYFYPIYPYNYSRSHSEVEHHGAPFFKEESSEHRNDYGAKPFVVNIEQATNQNTAFRKAIWTGDHLQVTLMSIPPGEDIGLEMHPDVDQFLRVEQGNGIVRMGKTRNNLSYVRHLHDGTAILIPAGTWHNIVNSGIVPLKLYSIYAPPNHPFGTIHQTKADAIEAEEAYD
ncbi:cupin domain-containing protein [Paenalkalicoccus suaedae]|uniref:Cupin domain-containing protein n=1 Tax=Paenalkalicoccus suaedae TaxID=2592382 RepID=A0A859FBL5_9BACI|nr:cupin domain-containing protein [Paenalkalicoccus suaedae]QKS70350.1 cupin domain-containing protein [Paenalkalicoccus suaedae]